MKARVLFSFACVLLFTTPATLVAQATYTIIDLGALGSDGYSVSRGVNSSAQVTGATGAGASSEVFFYANGSMTNLGTLGGTSGIGNAINTSGQVAGYSQNASGTYRAFLSSGSNLLDIGDLGGGSAVGYGINDLGQVVGSAVTTNGENHPFLYRNGRMIDLGTLGSSGND
jgi:probable HAF family extracellular repeat protein